MHSLPRPSPSGYSSCAQTVLNVSEPRRTGNPVQHKLHSYATQRGECCNLLYRIIQNTVWFYLFAKCNHCAGFCCYVLVHQCVAAVQQEQLLSFLPQKINPCGSLFNVTWCIRDIKACRDYCYYLFPFIFFYTWTTFLEIFLTQIQMGCMCVLFLQRERQTFQSTLYFNSIDFLININWYVRHYFIDLFPVTLKRQDFMIIRQDCMV